MRLATKTNAYCTNWADCGIRNKLNNKAVNI